MIRKTTWIMIGLFLAVLAFAFYWGRRPPQEAIPKAAPTLEALWTILLSEIEGLRVEDYVQGKSIQFQRDDKNGWVMIAPEQGPVDASLLEASIAWLANPKPERVFFAEEGLAEFGLLEPQGKIMVYISNQAVHELLIGGKAPIESYVYLGRPGSSEILMLHDFGVNSLMQLLEMESSSLLRSEDSEAETSATIEP